MIRLFIVAVALATLPHTALAENWPRFRGPNGAGVVDDAVAPTTVTKADYRWNAKLPGEGHSSPVIWGDSVFVTSADLAGGHAFLLCYNTADGSEKWRSTFPLEKYGKHKQNSFATPTPALDAERVYLLFQSKLASFVVAFTHAGKEVWRYDLGAFKAGHGSAVSPIVYENIVYVLNDQTGPSNLLALDAKTGEEVWNVSRETSRACYATPCIYQNGENPPVLVISHSYEGMQAFHLKTGAELWQIKPFGTHKQRACASPVIAGDLIIGTSGFATAEKNVVAIRPAASRSDDPSDESAKEAYRISKTAPHVPTPLVKDDRLYLWTDRGIVTCANANTGEEIWVKRVGGNYFSSPIWIDKKLYNLDVDGNLVVVAASDEYEHLGSSPLGEVANSSPAFADGVLYLRTASQLIAVECKQE